jgi:predicted transcriptional regulator
MSRRYDDPVEVRRRDDEPAEFLWRDRLWVVRAVLARWVETGAWWQAAVQSGAGIDSAALSVERELWRVEATRGRVHGMGVFELCFDWSATAGTGWTLARALD